MKKQDLIDWIKALRSGKFKQGKGQLCLVNGDNKTYCCLGVLAKIRGILSPSPADYRECIFKEGEKYFAILDPETEIEVNALKPLLMDDLIDKNDPRKWTFNQIADYLETFIDKAQ